MNITDFQSNGLSVSLLSVDLVLEFLFVGSFVLKLLELLGTCGQLLLLHDVGVNQLLSGSHI